MSAGHLGNLPAAATADGAGPAHAPERDGEHASTPAVVLELLRGARPAAGLLGTSVIARMIGHAAGAALLLVPAWNLGRLAVGVAEPGPLVAVTVALMVGAAFVKALCRYLEQLTGHIAAFRLLGRMRTELFDRLVPLAPAITDTHGTGRLMSAATRDIDRLEVFYAHTIAPVVTAVWMPLAGVAVAAVVAGPLPALVLLVGVGVGAIAVPVVGAGRARRAAREVVDRRTVLAQEVSDDLRGHTEILSFDAVEHRAGVVDAHGRAVAAAMRGTAGVLGRRAAMTLAWQAMTTIALLALAAFGPEGAFGVADATDIPAGSLGAAAAGWAALPALLLTIALVPAIAPALGSVEAFARSLPAALASARRLRELTTTSPAVADPARPHAVGRVRGTLDLENVTFAYPSRPDPALRDVDLHVPAGSFVAVVGATGSGKSTLARLLTRVWDPDVGAVRLDGVDLSDLALADLWREVTVFEQRPVLLAGTIRENLVLGRPDASAEQLAAACAAAGLTTDLDAMPDGLATRLGEHGQRLSGGQAQRLALARALLRRSPVLVLDEATSHQDALTQEGIIDRLRGAAGGTVVLITHRLATARAADLIVVLEEGRVVETGTYVDLIRAGGAFARLAAQ
ncbi:amino acid ABC transporter ATP-binding/permease protein [Occultella aeris]|uniref:Putative ABC transporter ATP-binding protein n=1 Tax=Occultella aeris TaxID=2761496 RepID=A0A7M4DFD3_9MICO|nr:ABC transporter ATP-binding protein [Occultella aeris]VZO35626.1 putative ABC transporter ATP-binding protein [Occultella aeris]